MMNTPDRLGLKCGEKRRMHCISDLYYWTTDEFAEPFLITEFFAESNTAHEDDLLAQDRYLEDLA